MCVYVCVVSTYCDDYVLVNELFVYIMSVFRHILS